MAFPWVYLLPAAAIGYLLWRKRSASASDVKGMLSRGAQIVDVRTKAEFRAQRHPKALNIPLDELGSRLKELDPKRPVLLCCASGSRSAMGVSLLRKKGFKEVANLGPWQRIQDLLA